MGKSHTTTRFWHRRSSEAVILVSLFLIILYLWQLVLGVNSLNQTLTVPLAVFVLASTTLVITLLTYFVAPLQKLNQSSNLNYALILATLTTLVILSNGIESTFLPLFIASLGFASFFGIWGVFIGTGSLATLLVVQYIISTVLVSDIITLSLLGGLPLVGSFLIWGRLGDKVGGDTKKDKAYHELANELSEVSGKSEIVISAIGDGVVALNSQGTIELINPAAERLLGWSKEDALKLSYKSVLNMLDTKTQPVNDTNDPILHCLTENKPLKNDSFSLQTKSGKTFVASISVNPVGQPGMGVIVVFRDITTEKSDERQRAEFISTASHEMRTPVASIEGYLGLALNPATAQIDTKARDFITKAHESAQHLGRLFADLLDVSKADDSRLKNDPKIINIIPFIQTIAQGLTPKANEKGLRMIYKPMPDGNQEDRDPVRKLNPVFYVNVDNDHLREVVQNLIENAIKYTPSGDVVIDVSGSDTSIVISIADTGIGIPKEDQSHLFQKFYRVDNSDTREIGGTGLGLYLCRRLTEAMGGRIWAESDYKQGSTFFVELARVDHLEAQKLIEQASIDAETAQMNTAKIIPPDNNQNNAPIITVAPPNTQPVPQPNILPNQIIQPNQQPPIIPQTPQDTASDSAPIAPESIIQPPITLSDISQNPTEYLNSRPHRLNIPPRQY